METQSRPNKLLATILAATLAVTMVPSQALAHEDGTSQAPEATAAPQVAEVPEDAVDEAEIFTEDADLAAIAPLEAVTEEDALLTDETEIAIIPEAEETPEAAVEDAVEVAPLSDDGIVDENAGISAQTGSMNNPVYTSLRRNTTGYVYNDGSFSSQTKEDYYAIDLTEAGTYVIRGANTTYIDKGGVYSGPAFEVYDQYHDRMVSFTTNAQSTRPQYKAFNITSPGRIYIKVYGGSFMQRFDYSFVVVKQGWYLNNGRKYYYGDDGLLVTGWKTISGARYFFKPADGAAAKGLVQIYGSRYYLDPTTCKMQTGWRTISGARYFFKPADGAAAKGLVQIYGSRYYLDPKTNKMATGWKTISGSRYFFKPANGAAAKGLVQIYGSRYYLDPKTNKMATGWKQINGYWYFFKPANGAAAKGLVQIHGSHYYLNPSTNRMATGWQKINGYWRYFESNGAMAKNKWIGNYYVKSNGVMATNQWVGRYYVNGSGLWVATR